MQRHSYSLYDLTIHPDRTVSSSSFDGQKFDPSDFSRLKYGDGAIAKQYADQLAKLFVTKNLLSKDEPYFLCGSAYQTVPTAAIVLAELLITSLRDQGYDITYFKVDGQAFSDDFSRKNLSERRATLAHITLSLPVAIQKVIKGRKVIIIDDIKVTGLHESAIAALLTAHEADVAIFGYIAALKKEGSFWWPEIEWELNHHFVRDLSSLLEIINTDNFIPNARVCKFILSQDQQSLRIFLQALPLDAVVTLAKLVRADGYHSLPDFRENFALIDASAKAVSTTLEAY